MSEVKEGKLECNVKGIIKKTNQTMKSNKQNKTKNSRKLKGKKKNKNK